MFSDSFLINYGTVLYILPVFILFGLVIYSNVKQGMKNRNSPLLKVPAEVVLKQIKIWGDPSRIAYFVTFAVESGDCVELKVSGKEYGVLEEKDLGVLSFQGTRYINFECK